MTKEDEKATISALLKERRGYVQRGDEERVKQVDAELRRLGASAEPKAKRATKRAK